MTKLVLSLSISRRNSLFLSQPSLQQPSPSPVAFPSARWRQRLAELVLEHVLQVSDVELRREDASSAGGRPGGGGGGVLGGLREAQPEGVPEALEVSLGVVDALPQRVESGHVKHSLGLLWVRLMDAVVSWLLTTSQCDYFLNS